MVFWIYLEWSAHFSSLIYASNFRTRALLVFIRLAIGYETSEKVKADLNIFATWFEALVNSMFELRRIYCGRNSHTESKNSFYIPSRSIAITHHLVKSVIFLWIIRDSFNLIASDENHVGLKGNRLEKPRHSDQGNVTSYSSHNKVWVWELQRGLPLYLPFTFFSYSYSNIKLS